MTDRKPPTDETQDTTGEGDDSSASDAERVVATLLSPRGASLFTTTDRSMTIGHRLFRIAAIVGLGLCLYIVGLKLPAVLLDPSSMGFLTRVTDPIVATLVVVFGALWCGVGICHLWASWAFARLRSMQTDVEVVLDRPRREILRGFLVTVTGVVILCLGIAYARLLLT